MKERVTLKVGEEKRQKTTSRSQDSLHLYTPINLMENHETNDAARGYDLRRHCDSLRVVRRGVTNAGNTCPRQVPDSSCYRSMLTAMLSGCKHKGYLRIQ
jgi:hypothetical protein